MEINSLWEHQKAALERARNLQEFGLFLDLGTGKTRTTIEILRERFTDNGRLLRTLILGPSVVVENWKREFAKFSKIQAQSILLLQGTGKQRAQLLATKGFEGGERIGKIAIANYQTLLMPEVFELLQTWHPEAIVLDESHRIKNPGAKTTKAAIRLGDMATFRYILTGTPVLQSLLDLYSQFRFLDKGATFGQNYFVFRNTYFYDKNAGMPSQKHFPDWRVKPNAEKEISEKISSKTIVARKEECLTLPPLVRKVIYLPLSSEQEKHYSEMKKHFITFLGDKACTAQLAITKALRLQQIVSGYIKLEDGSDIKLKSNPRQDALRELLEDLAPNHKVIVWACFKENYEQIRSVCESLGLVTRELHGEVNKNQRQAAIDDFNNDPTVRVFIGNQGAAGIGVNLTSSNYSIYYSRGFSLEHQLQSEARNYRGGSEQHERVTHIHLVASQTIDELIMEALANKNEVSEKVLREISIRL